MRLLSDGQVAAGQTARPACAEPAPDRTPRARSYLLSGQVGAKADLAHFQAGPPVGTSLYGGVVKGALTVHGPRGAALDLAQPVSYPSLAKTRVLLAMQRRFCSQLSAYETRRGLMKLHDYVRDEHQGDMTIEEFACLLVAAGYCSKHLTERTGNAADGWTCLPCEQGLHGLFS